MCSYIDDWDSICVKIVLRALGSQDPKTSNDVQLDSIPLLASLCHRLDTHERAPEALDPIKQTLRETYATHGKAPQSLEAAWSELRTDESDDDRPLYGSYGRKILLRDPIGAEPLATGLTFVAINSAEVSEHHRLLKANATLLQQWLSPKAISSLRKSIALEDRLLDVIAHNAEPWLNHDNPDIYGIFMDGDLPSAIVRRMARYLLSFPDRGKRGALEEVQKLLRLLLTKGVWVKPLFDVFRESPIRKYIDHYFSYGAMSVDTATGSSAHTKSLTETSPDDEGQVFAAELTRFISQIGTGFMLSEWIERYEKLICPSSIRFTYLVGEEAIDISISPVTTMHLTNGSTSIKSFPDACQT